MLGKTNITTLTEGAVVTEIEDYNWIQMQSGIYGNFAKAVYANDYLAAITADGTIAYVVQPGEFKSLANARKMRKQCEELGVVTIIKLYEQSNTQIS